MDLKTVPIDKIKEDLAPLTKARQRSLLDMGQIEPIRLAAVNGHYEIIDGRRRLADMRETGATEVMALVEDEPTAKERALKGLALNLGRSDNPMNEAEMIEELLGYGLAVGEIATSVGAKQPVISQRKALLNLIPELRQAMKAGDLLFTAGRYACKWTKAQQREFYDAGDLTVKAAKAFNTALQAGTFTLDDLGLPELDNPVVPGLFLDGETMAQLQAGQTVTVSYQGQAIQLSAGGDAATPGDSS